MAMMPFDITHDYTFAAFGVPDSESPLRREITKFQSDRMAHHFGRSWTICAMRDSVPILTVYGAEAFDKFGTKFLMISHIVFGSMKYQDFELPDTDETLTQLFEYIYDHLSMSTDCIVTYPDNGYGGVDGTSYLKSYDSGHLYPSEIIREWTQKYTPSRRAIQFNKEIDKWASDRGLRTVFRLVGNGFSPILVFNYLKYGWQGAFFIQEEPNRFNVFELNEESYSGLKDVCSASVSAKRYEYATLCGFRKWIPQKGEYNVFIHPKLENSHVVVLNLPNTQYDYVVSNHGKNMSAYIQELIDADMKRNGKPLSEISKKMESSEPHFNPGDRFTVKVVRSKENSAMCTVEIENETK